MSFIKKVFGFGGKKKENEQDSTSSNTKNNSGSNYSKCKAVAFPYIETNENNLLVENISIFDGKTLQLDKLHAQFIEAVKDFKTTDYKDDYRVAEANSKGGIEFQNKEITSLIRSSATDIIKQVGRKILSGDFNLTTISFPIRVMIPLTILQSIARSFFQLPYYMHICQNLDVVERFKYVITAAISPFFCSCFFLKPLNPVLGETYEAMFSDGSKIYLEQTSHHPPVSHYEVYGPNGSYYFSGYSNYSSSAGVNSCSVTNTGKRFIKFKDGMEVHFDFCKVRLF